MPDYEEKDEFLKAVGEGITIWADIEYQLSILFSACLKDISGAAMDSFYAIQQFNTKLKAVDAAAKSALPIDKNEEKLKSWKNLFNRLDRLSRTRNHLAHYQFRFGITEDDEAIYVLAKPHLPSRASEDEIDAYFDKHHLTLEKIQTYINKCKKLLDDLKIFNDEKYKNIKLMLAMQRQQELHK